MYIPTLSQAKLAEKELAKHQKRLNEILTQDRKNKYVDKEFAQKEKIAQARQNYNKLAHKGKLEVIEQENELLLGKLVEISRKKSPLVAVKLENNSHSAKSLHGIYRKKEMDRIALENEAFARRLISQQPTFSRKKLDTDYKKHRDLVTHMKRLGTTPSKSVPKKLPPLKIDAQNGKIEQNMKSADLKDLVRRDENSVQSEQPKRRNSETTQVSSADDKTTNNTLKNQEVKAKEATEVRAQETPRKDGKTTPVPETKPQTQSQDVVQGSPPKEQPQKVENSEPKEKETESENKQNETKPVEQRV